MWSPTHRITYSSHMLESRNLPDRVREVGVKVIHALLKRVDEIQRALHFGTDEHIERKRENEAVRWQMRIWAHRRENGIQKTSCIEYENRE